MEIIKSHDFIVNKIKNHVPLMRYDGKEDYASWKTRAQEKLYELLGLPLESCEDNFTVTADENCGWFRKVSFVFQSEPGHYVQGMFTVPHGEKKARPLAVCIQGHTSGMHLSVGVEKFPVDGQCIKKGDDFGIRAMKEGCCAVMLEQRYMGTCGQIEEEDVGGPLCARKNAALPSLLLGRTAFGERVWDAQRLLDVAFKYFGEYIDQSQVLCLGNSGGGTATFYLSCVDDRITVAIPSCYVCEFDYSIVPLHHCCCNYIPGIRKYFDMGDMAGMIADRKLVIVCGIQDPDFPVEGVEKSYERALSTFNAIGRGKYCRLVKGPEGHRYYPDLAWPVVNDLRFERV